MKKRRAWTTLDEDADDQESAALAASLAAAKDTAARSGALLSSVKEDLTDHQRWLRAQSAAVKRDRDRHERWLKRQEELRLANAKKDRVSRHRRLVRKRALQAVRDAFADLYLFIRSWIVFGVRKVVGAVRFVAASIANGAVFVWRGLARWAGSALTLAGSGVSTMASTVGQTFALGGRKLGLAVRGASAGVAAGAAWSGSKASASVKAGSQALAAGSQVVAAGAGKLSRKTGKALGSGGRAIGSGLSATGGSAASLASATSAGLASGASAVAAKAAKLGATGGRSLSRATAVTASRAAAIPSNLFIHLARIGREVQHFARVRVPAPRKPEAPPLPEDVSAVGNHAQSETEARQDAGHTASVHVFETYGPHPEGTRLFGQPANEPWTPETRSDGGEGLASPETGASGGSGQSLSSNAGLGSDVGARMGDVLSSWGRGANRRASGVAAGLRRRAGAGSAWLRQQTSRGLASAQTGMAAAARAQSGVVAQGAAWAQKRGLDLSQMMIIAGAVLLVLGGLLVGGGFLMRSTAGPVIAGEPGDETFSKISWTFDQPGLALPDRSVFTLSGTPESFLINGISIAGVNNSDEALTDLEAVLAPDVQRPDLKLDVVVESQDGEPSSPGPVATVPPGDAFRLVFLFPPEATGSADGISAEEFFESYGGLLLKLRYEADGAARSMIQYLDPEMLKAQLDEVSAEAGGS